MLNISPEWWTTILQWLLGGGLAAVVGAAIKGFAQKRKLNAEAERTGADTAQVLAEATKSLLAPMNEQVDVMERRLRAANEVIDQQAVKLRADGITIEEQARQIRHNVQLIAEQGEQLANQAKLIETLQSQITAMSAELERLRHGTPSQGGKTL